MSKKLIARRSTGRCSHSFKEALRGSEAALLNQDIHLFASVGRRATNNSGDIKVVQGALKAIPEKLGGKPDIKVDGIVGPITQGAIDKFQALHFGSDKADGTVEVRNRTQAKLSSLQPKKLARMEFARAQLSSARACIDSAINTLLLATVELTPAGRNAAAMIERHFGISATSDPALARSQIGAIYRDMKMVFARESAFGGDGFTQHFESEPFSNPTVFAFTVSNGVRDSGVYGGVLDDFGNDSRWFRHDTIYLSAFYDVTTNDDRIQTIVHELAHFLGATGADSITDHAYGDVDSPAVANLTTSQKMHNAECYGNFAFEARFGRSPTHKS